jgi:hypothetical protein
LNVGVLGNQILVILKFQIEMKKNVEPCWCFDNFEGLLFTSGKSNQLITMVKIGQMIYA